MNRFHDWHFDAEYTHAAQVGMQAAIGGKKLSTVVFVWDYIQLLFDNACLTAITNPEVVHGQRVLHRGDSGYRDALCEQIGRMVLTCVVRTDEAIEILFDDSRIVRISLRERDYEAADAALFYCGDQFWAF